MFLSSIKIQGSDSTTVFKWANKLNFVTPLCYKSTILCREMFILSRYVQKYLILIAFLLGGYTTSFKHSILQYFFYEKFSDAQFWPI